MAETLEQIYFNTAVGATELDDGEHTIVTTDANTSYVIKDVMVKDNSLLTSNTYLELNGFNVGELTGNSGGSLIIPPNSTLKIKTTDYPFAFAERKIIAGNGSDNKLGVQYGYRLNGTSTNSIEVGGVSYNTSVSSYNYIDDAMYTKNPSTGVEYIHYSWSDSNSQQGVKYARVDLAGTGTNRNENYRPFGFSEESYYGRKAWVLDSGYMRYLDVDTDPTTATYVTPSVTLIPGKLKTNNYSPQPTSSYPRAIVSQGYYWYVPSNAYSNSLHAVNLFTGGFFRFNFTSTWNTGNSYQFSVGYNPSTDKFTVYRMTGTTTVLWDDLPLTRTQLDTVDNNVENQYNVTDYGTISLGFAAGSSYAGLALGNDELGNLVYTGSNAVLYVVNKQGSVLEEMSSLIIGTTTLTPSSNNIFTMRSRRVPAAEAASLGLTGPSFGMQILGVKSTV